MVQEEVVMMTIYRMYNSKLERRLRRRRLTGVDTEKGQCYNICDDNVAESWHLR